MQGPHGGPIGTHSNPGTLGGRWVGGRGRADYLEMPAPPMHQDVLKWWASNETKFSALSVMARQYLGVPATSASAEREAVLIPSLRPVSVVVA